MRIMKEGRQERDTHTLPSAEKEGTNQSAKTKPESKENSLSM